VFWVISVQFDLRNTLPKLGPFLLGHPVYIYTRDRLIIVHIVYVLTVGFVISYVITFREASLFVQDFVLSECQTR